MLKQKANLKVIDQKKESDEKPKLDSLGKPMSRAKALLERVMNYSHRLEKRRG